MGTCDLEPLRVMEVLSLPEGTRFTSLFGANCDALAPELGSIGAADDPLENVSDGESGPTLDLGLLPCDMGMVERRRIHDPLDEIESRLVSSPLCS